jgi:phage terminase Nu1 subunit (DNA packaging protein)
MKVRTVSVQDLGAILGVDVRTIANLVKEGMPKTARGTYDLCKCVHWYLDRERTAARQKRSLNELELARKRKIDIDTRRGAVELAREEAAVMPIEVAEQQLRERLETVAGGVKAIHRYQPDIKAAVTDEAADALCDRMIDEVLAELHGLKDSID